MAIKHPDGWIISTSPLGGNDTNTNSPTKSEPDGWVNAPVTQTPSILPENIIAKTIDADSIKANSITAELIKAGAITADKINVTQLSAITADMGSLTSGNITIDSAGYIRGGMTAYLTGAGFWLGYDTTAYKLSIGDSAGAYMSYDGTDLNIEGGSINASTITALASGSEVAIQQWSYTGSFSVTDDDTVAWTGGTLTFMDGTDFTITGSNTGDMAAFTYIYLDIGVSTTSLQTATSFTAGAGKTLIAVAQPGTSEASFLMMGGSGEYNIDGSNIAAASIIANKISVSNLAAISADLGTITSGSVTLDTTGFIKGGQTAYATGTGFFLGYDTDAYKLSIGSSTQYIRWDGTSLTIEGADVSIDAGTGTITADTINATNLSVEGVGVGSTLGGLVGTNGLTYIPATSMVMDSFGGTVITAKNGFRMVGSGGSADDECTIWLGTTTTNQISLAFLGAFDMSDPFEIGGQCLLQELGGWTSGQNGSLLWIGWANIFVDGLTGLTAKANLSSVDHAGIFLEYTNGTGWTAYLKTGDGTNTTEVNMGTSYAPTTSRNYKITFDGTTVTAWIDNVAIATSTTNLPDITSATYATMFRSFSESAGSSRRHNLTVLSPYAIMTVK